MPKQKRTAVGKQGTAVATRKRTGGSEPKTRQELYRHTTTTLIKGTAGTSMAVACLLGLLFVLIPGTTALAGAGPTESLTIQAAADPSPSPSLGSTEASNPHPAGDSDSDPADYSGAGWIVLAVVVLAVLIVTGTWFWFRGRRKDLNP
jgi:hypothetical protein